MANVLRRAYHAGMEWLVSAGLLVAVAAWVAGLCHRLQHLRTEVRGAWQDWLEDTRRRNKAAGEFAEFAALLLPPGEMLPRTLRRLVADSDRLLPVGERLLWTENVERVRTEGELRRELSAAARRAEDWRTGRADDGLERVSEELLQRMERYEQSGRRFRLAAEAYNAALAEPPVRLLAPSLGFLRVVRTLVP